MKKHTKETIKITLLEVFTLPQEKDLVIECPEHICQYLEKYHPEAFDYITSFVQEYISFGCILNITLPCISFNITVHIKKD